MMRTAVFQSLVHQVQTWFSQARQQATEPEEVLKDVPESYLLELRQIALQLTIPIQQNDAIQEMLTAAVTRWRESLDAENSLVIIAPPSEPLREILTLALEDWPQVAVELVQPLEHYYRPRDPLAIQAQLSNALAPDEESESSWNSSKADQPRCGKEGANPIDSEQTVEDQLASRRQVVLIPALEQCFLRCIQGWEGIEYLQHLVVQDPSRFWIIGCSSWCWAFLDRVCQISAYLETVEPLPPISKQHLQQWLEPLTQAVDQHLPETTEEGSAERTSWSALASLADGRGAIATALWLNSLGIRKDDLPADETADDSPPNPALYPRKPILPSLPSLTAVDRYLLHSLLLHQSLNRSQLALSLGESETIVRSRVQILRRSGVILQNQGSLTVNPIHYPRLRSELSNNNFLIGEI